VHKQQYQAFKDCPAFDKSSSALKICASDKPSNLMPFSTPKSSIKEQITGNQGPSQIDLLKMMQIKKKKKKIP